VDRQQDIDDPQSRREKFGLLRLACYGRVDKGLSGPVSSRRWQLDVPPELIAGRGRIAAEFFDVRGTCGPTGRKPRTVGCGRGPGIDEIAG
jgi:hypothetical protein